MIRARITLALALVLLFTLPLTALAEQPTPTDALPTATPTPFMVESPAPPEATATAAPDAPQATRAPIPEADMPAPGADSVAIAIVTDTEGASLFEMPSTESAILASLAPAQVLSLQILGVTWSRVADGAVTGWVPTYALGFSFGSPQPGVAVVIAPGGRLTLRAKMSTRADAVGTAYSGHAVLLLAKSEDFSLIRAGGKEGYVLTRYLREEFPGRSLGTLTPVISIVSTREANVRLRAEPSRQGAVYTTVKSGNRVVVFERENGWARVEFEGHSGYMMEQYLGAIE